MLVVAPNLCFDRTLRVERFAVGAVVRPYAAEVTCGGKGVNVVRTLADLGVPADLLGLLGDEDAERFEQLAHAEGLSLQGLRVPGPVRQATVVVEDDARATVLNEPGRPVDPDHADRLLDAAATLLGGSSVLTCTGSLQPGLPTDTYGRLVDLARARGVLAVCDAARAVLADVLPHEPDLVTPNLHEAEGLVADRRDEASHEDAALEGVQDRAFAAGDRLRAFGARRVLVTAGTHGAAYVGLDPRDRLWLDAPRVALVNPIGAGDALVGGLVAALDRGADWVDACRWGVAVASAAVEHPVAGRVDAGRARELARAGGGAAG